MREWRFVSWRFRITNRDGLRATTRFPQRRSDGRILVDAVVEELPRYPIFPQPCWEDWRGRSTSKGTGLAIA